jgi:hypothetical protein
MVLAWRGHYTDASKPREVILKVGGIEFVIEVDHRTQKLPVHDIIQIFGFTVEATELIVSSLMEAHPELTEAIGIPIKLNGTGDAKLCAPLNTILELMWMIPNKDRAFAFRASCVNDIILQMHGSPRPISELCNLTDFRIWCKKASVQCVVLAGVFAFGSAFYLANLPLISWMCDVSDLPGGTCSMWHRFGFTAFVGGVVHLGIFAAMCGGLSLVLAWACDHLEEVH